MGEYLIRMALCQNHSVPNFNENMLAHVYLLYEVPVVASSSSLKLKKIREVKTCEEWLSVKMTQFQI